MDDEDQDKGPQAVMKGLTKASSDLSKPKRDMHANIKMMKIRQNAQD